MRFDRPYARDVRTAAAALTLAAVAGGCMRSDGRGERATLAVMNAASVTRPVRAVLDSFAVRTGVRFTQEPGASLELARRITEMGRRPDVVILADPEVFPKLLMPAHASWYALFGRNRIVLAYTPRSRWADSIDAANWRAIVTRPGVEVGRADPDTDPSGYRTLLVFQLAERHYREPGLARRLLAAAPARNVRPREAEQVALLQAGELDYIWTYESLARNAGLRYVKLPDDVDLGDPDSSAVYATASTRVLGRRPGDTLTVRGAPVLFALSIPRGAPDSTAAASFVAFLMGPDGRRILRRLGFDALDRPLIEGSGVPAPVARAVGSRDGR